MCDVLLPPDVNPTAVKYIYIIYLLHSEDGHSLFILLVIIIIIISVMIIIIIILAVHPQPKNEPCCDEKNGT
jgi:hypothetical protein